MAAGEEEEEEESRRGRRREGEIESAGADCMGKGATERRRPGTTLFELSRRPRFHEQSTRAGGFTAARQTGQSWWFVSILLAADDRMVARRAKRDSAMERLGARWMHKRRAGVVMSLRWDGLALRRDKITEFGGAERPGASISLLNSGGRQLPYQLTPSIHILTGTL